MNEALPETWTLIADILRFACPSNPGKIVPLPLTETLQSGLEQVSGPSPPQDPHEAKHSDLAEPPPVRLISCAEAVCERPVNVPLTAIAISQFLILGRLNWSVRRGVRTVKDNR